MFVYDVSAGQMHGTLGLRGYVYDALARSKMRTVQVVRTLMGGKRRGLAGGPARAASTVEIMDY